MFSFNPFKFLALTGKSFRQGNGSFQEHSKLTAISQHRWCKSHDVFPTNIDGLLVEIPLQQDMVRNHDVRVQRTVQNQLEKRVALDVFYYLFVGCHLVIDG